MPWQITRTRLAMRSDIATARLGLLDRLILLSGGSPDSFKVIREKEASHA